jgi:hypothetical protein
MASKHRGANDPPHRQRYLLAPLTHESASPRGTKSCEIHLPEATPCPTRARKRHDALGTDPSLDSGSASSRRSRSRPWAAHALPPARLSRRQLLLLHTEDASICTAQIVEIRSRESGSRSEGCRSDAFETPNTRLSNSQRGSTKFARGYAASQE